ncbi:hypothetical protein DPMN_128925 [Dreissena polymorpha]|uniref:Uncharacterized protein n=1 Tax=Dreissena polymorpha TaxID=45954 RepID=A0A9D4H828_DREPO|nr:hypothetical protein DPMN_128925 [Dreissena polymorpha]
MTDRKSSIARSMASPDSLSTPTALLISTRPSTEVRSDSAKCFALSQLPPLA